MHNGVISTFTTIRRDLEDLLSYDAYCNVLGESRVLVSEHLPFKSTRQPLSESLDWRSVTVILANCFSRF